MTGTKYKDYIITATQGETSHGLEGDDSIYNYFDNSILYGDQGDDLLSSNFNNSILSGGEGHDIFAVSNYYSQPQTKTLTITDFDINDPFEKIDLRQIPGLSDLSKINISQSSGDAVLSFDNGNKLILKNVNAADLKNENFVFTTTLYQGTEAADTMDPYFYNQDNQQSTLTFQGKGGNDLMFSPYLTNYVLDGGSGDDRLIAQSGGMLIGGTGADSFIIINSYSKQTVIADFEVNNPYEKIIINSFSGIDNFQDLTLVQLGEDVLVKLNNSYDTSNTILIKNVSLSELSANNFEFGNVPEYYISSSNMEIHDGIANGTDGNDLFAIRDEPDLTIIHAGKGQDLIYIPQDYQQSTPLYLYGDEGDDALDFDAEPQNGIVNVLDGGSGNDVLESLNGGVRFIGGADNDIFVAYRKANSQIIIQDLEVNNKNEFISLVDFENVNSIADLHLTQEGNNTVINLDDNQKIILENVNKNDLSEKNFGFVLSNKELSGDIANNPNSAKGYFEPSQDWSTEYSQNGYLMVGGAGKDNFVFYKSAGQTDLIKDFDISSETISLKNFSDIKNFSDLNITYYQDEYSSRPNYFALIDLGEGQFIKINNASEQHPLNAANFVFNNIPVNHDPIATLTSQALNRNTQAIIDVLAKANDADGDSLKITKINGQSLVNEGGKIYTTYGVVVLLADPVSGYQKLQYVPKYNYFGTDSFTYTISDGHGGETTQTLNLNVNKVNYAPLASAIPLHQIDLDRDFNFVIDKSKYFLDADGDILSFKSATLANGKELPSWLHFDKDSGTFFGNPGLATNDFDNYRLTVKLTVTDNHGGEVSTNFTIFSAHTSYGDNADNVINDNADGKTIFGLNGNDKINGNDGDDNLVGGNGNDTLNGGNGNDHLYGDNGNDILSGGKGDDILSGGLGKDTLTGGAGKDSFNFSSLKDSTKTNMDLIMDFTKGQDKIDLSAINSSIAETDHDLNFDSFKINIKNGHTIIEDKHSDFGIELNGVIHLDQGDFHF